MGLVGLGCFGQSLLIPSPSRRMTLCKCFRSFNNMKTEPYLVKVFGCRLQSTISSILSSKVEMFWIYSIQQVSSLHSFNLQNSLYSTTSTSKSKNLPTCPHGRVGPLFPVLIPPPTPLLSHTLTCVGSPITWSWWEERAGRVRRCE